jgi:RNA polymerase sigma factor (sigma-70 family)
LNEQAFILLLQQGDQQAFRQLVEQWQHMVYNTVLGFVQDTAEAEDLAQEVFIQAFQSIQQFRAESKLSTWLYRIAVTKVLDAERKKKAKKRMSHMRVWLGMEEKEQAPAVFYHPGVQLDNREKAAMLFRALRSLPPNQRAAFVLIKTEGLSYEEVAGIMKLSIKAVEALMHRAKENLRKQLDNYFHQ